MEGGGPTQVTRGRGDEGGHMRPSHRLRHSEAKEDRAGWQPLDTVSPANCPAERKHMVRRGPFLLTWICCDLGFGGRDN